MLSEAEVPVSGVDVSRNRRDSEQRLKTSLSREDNGLTSDPVERCVCWHRRGWEQAEAELGPLLGT